MISLPLDDDDDQNGQGIVLSKEMKGIMLGSFMMAVLGKPGSGKTTILQGLLTDQRFFAGRFNRILYVGPIKFKKIQLNEHNWIGDYDEQWLKSKIQYCQGFGVRNLLIVFDDVVTSWKYGSDTFLQNLCFKRRHMMKTGCISIILTTQQFVKIPTFARTCLNSMIAFRVSKAEFEIIHKQLMVTVDKIKLKGILCAQGKRHRFAFLNIESGSVFDQFFRQYQDSQIEEQQGEDEN